MAQDDDRLQNYQDELDNDESMTDPVMSELNDDPTEELGVPPEEFKRELDDLAIDDDNATNGAEEAEDENARERIEDLDEDPDGQ